MKPIKVIVNPAAGHGNGIKAVPAIKNQLLKQGLTFNLVVSSRPGQAVELARQAAVEGYEIIVAAGGDGTVNEVLNGVMQARQMGAPLPALGVLCVGRGNDFAGSVGIPADLEQACLALAEGCRRRIDIGRVVGGNYPQGRYFANCVGVGFDAIATIEVGKLPRWGGFLSFLLAVLKTIFLYNQAPLAKIEFNGQVLTQRSLMISIMNGRRLGGKFIMAPESQQDDGVFDLCIAEQMTQLKILKLLPHFFKGTQASQPTIKTGKAARVSITAQDGPLPAQTDGEIICTEGTHLEIELLPRQVEIIWRPG